MGCNDEMDGGMKIDIQRKTELTGLRKNEKLWIEVEGNKALVDKIESTVKKVAGKEMAK
jgi:hypothetical protein